MERVLYVSWCGFVYVKCAVCVVVWFCLWKVCCMCCGVVLFMDSVLYVLWCSFIYGQCALCVVAWFSIWRECCMCRGVVLFT